MQNGQVESFKINMAKKKTKKIPKGYHKMPNGKLMKGSSHAAYLKNKKKY